MKSQPQPMTQEVLAGPVERVTFHNEESGFCVLRIKARGHRELVTVIGHAAVISAGEWITASGEWINDRTHGQQFKAKFLKTSEPTSLDGIEKYLGSGMIRGIGPVYAQKLVRAFGVRCSIRSRQSPSACARSQALALSEPTASLPLGQNRRSFAKSWSSYTATESARRERCGFSRPTAPMPCRSCPRTPIAWLGIFGA